VAPGVAVECGAGAASMGSAVLGAIGWSLMVVLGGNRKKMVRQGGHTCWE
jgi:hypothetical protein